MIQQGHILLLIVDPFKTSVIFYHKKSSQNIMELLCSFTHFNQSIRHNLMMRSHVWWRSVMKCFSNSNTFFWCLGNVNLPWQKCLKKSYSPNENALISRCHMICVNFVTKTNELSFFSIRQYNVGCNVSHVKLALTCFY